MIRRPPRSTLFSLHNLIRDAPFSKLDLISCRNLLIYLDPALQSRIIPLFHFALRHGGYLFLGPSENVTQHTRLFAKVDAKYRIFKAQPVGVERPVFEMPLGAVNYRNQAPAEKGALSPGDDGVSRRAARMMEAYAPAYVVVDENHDVMHFAGRAGKYPSLPRGPPASTCSASSRPASGPTCGPFCIAPRPPARRRFAETP